MSHAAATPALPASDLKGDRIGMARLTRVELRKMFDTRSGFWLLISIFIVALVASTGVVIWVHADSLSYSTFAGAFGIPMSVLLPVMAILAVTGEWSQRTGLVSFTMVPHRSRVIAAKLIAVILAGVGASLVVMALGALFNLLGAAVRGITPVWDESVAQFLVTLLGFVLSMLIGFMLGLLLRNSAAALVGYFVYLFVIPIIFNLLRALTGVHGWFSKLQPWIDFQSNVGSLSSTSGAKDWAHLAVSSLPWFFIPMAIGLVVVLRSEVK